MAQRLVRRLCPDCRQPLEPDPALLQEVNFPEIKEQGSILGPAGCEACRMTGFRGRQGIFEMLQVSEAIESHVIARKSTNEIKQQAITEGMSTLREDGWRKVLAGITTIEEVLRVTGEDQ